MVPAGASGSWQVALLTVVGVAGAPSRVWTVYGESSTLSASTLLGNESRVAQVTRFVVSYDLNKPGQDYTSLHNRLKALGAIRVQYSTWIVRLNGWDESKLATDLWRYMDKTDSLLVLNLATGQASWFNLMADPRPLWAAV